LPLKNKTKQFFIPFIWCILGRSRIENERKEKAREKERKVREKHKKKIKEKRKEKWENNLVNLQNQTYKILI
jgi:hypothetical protein